MDDRPRHPALSPCHLDDYRPQGGKAAGCVCVCACVHVCSGPHCARLSQPEPRVCAPASPFLPIPLCFHKATVGAVELAVTCVCFQD